MTTKKYIHPVTAKELSLLDDTVERVFAPYYKFPDEFIDGTPIHEWRDAKVFTLPANLKYIVINQDFYLYHNIVIPSKECLIIFVNFYEYGIKEKLENLEESFFTSWHY